MTATDTYLLLRAFCQELARCGMRDACTSPGSRNTPILISLVRQPQIRCASHIDERCAGFYALGAAKASGLPVAVTCTSGTAAANLAPAVIEAHEAGVPLIVLTADRPPELREVGAGQTIDQVKLYGSAVKWFFEVGVQEATPERLRWIRSLACRAYWTALDGRPGPVHLNVPLREPLVLDAPLPDDPAPGRPDGGPWLRAPSAPAAARPPGGVSARGVLVAGRAERRPELAARLAAFAVAAGYPLLADPLSGARRGDGAIATYDLLLRSPALAAELAPEVVIRVGDLPTSKPLRQWLAGLDARQLLLDPERAWQDPASVVAETIGALPEPPTPTPAWLARWRAADAVVAATLGEALGGELSEPAVAARLGASLPAAATLFVAASMPVRDIEEFWPVRDDPPRVLSNRGANGIDGTVSSAFGVAAVTDAPVVLLIGDVALAHDIGGLLAARRLGLSLTIVLLNNDGGGIFHFLPVAGEADAFEEHVATPHGLEFASAAALYGCGHTLVTDTAGFDAALARSLAGPGTTIIEVRTDRDANRALHARVADAAAAALRAHARISGGI
ncbi:MAG TPA: 2-succinyl-5-enolpyruvyl-6-hydroxy-3-cyclohexene-1-carboxylic-acid synthase [Solirubrobacteraceae bacterium]|nr:2-succinyl-5-enolpyruvyl-6-hydroxy-3-cyclohexene-1-carboxylic-acid synthase [Solirubrobacteraceae bacterium]